MTTAPRKTPTLRQSVDSALANGWTPTIFAEPGSDLEGITCPIIQHPQKLGIFHNWKMNAQTLLAQPEATHFLTMQDDAVLIPNTRLLVEQWEWPPDAAALSLYLPSQRTRKGRHRRPPGIQKLEGSTFHGNLAVVYRREVLTKILTHPLTARWSYRTRHPSAVVDDDICIGQVVMHLRLKIYYAIPSCAQHVSPHSTRLHAGGCTGIRCADWVASDALKDCQPIGT